MVVGWDRLGWFGWARLGSRVGVKEEWVLGWLGLGWPGWLWDGGVGYGVWEVGGVWGLIGWEGSCRDSHGAQEDRFETKGRRRKRRKRGSSRKRRRSNCRRKRRRSGRSSDSSKFNRRRRRRRRRRRTRKWIQVAIFGTTHRAAQMDARRSPGGSSLLAIAPGGV